MYISIHTPAKGATGLSLCKLDAVGDFNPHTREGCDTLIIASGSPVRYFNPHTREGCDSYTGSMLSYRTLFQSTHPRRVRQMNKLTALLLLLFQSTHPRRVRHAYRRTQVSLKKFQSTHPRRVRLVYRKHAIIPDIISIHTPAKGATNE